MASLSLLLTPERVLDLAVTEADPALRALAAAVAGGGSGLDLERLHAAILEREALASTGFGGGLAMPHVRLPEARRFELALCRARAGVPFAALDGAPVRLALLVVGPEGDRQRYQKLMSRAARFLKAEGPRLMECDDLSTAVATVVDQY